MTWCISRPMGAVLFGVGRTCGMRSVKLGTCDFTERADGARPRAVVAFDRHEEPGVGVTIGDGGATGLTPQLHPCFF